jgi:1-deoxy-D-xylulose-5-phosphate reductoisomerase
MKPREKIVLLGATGSIGSSTLDIIRQNPERFELIGISGYKNYSRLEKIIEEFSPEIVSIREENKGLIAKFPKVHFLMGEKSLSELASLSEADTVILGIAGIAGLAPTLAAIKNGKKILSANKESIVAAGRIVRDALLQYNNAIIPLDSEHNAIFNIAMKFEKDEIRNITLTASGGPFLKKEITEKTSVEDVLAHPTWDMGNTISVNSATMMNKGFEVIEARFLFDIDYDKIKVLIHPQSLVHGIVELVDGTQILSASPSDMRYPIAAALFYPEIPSQNREQLPRLDLSQKNLGFSLPDFKRFPLLQLAYDCGKEAGLLPTALNAINETIVEAFLERKVNFISLPQMIQRSVLEFSHSFHFSGELSMEAVMEADKFARSLTRKGIR